MTKRGRRAMRLLIFAAMQCVAAALPAQETPLDPEWQRIVVAMNWSTPRAGAFGALWQTRWTLHNSAAREVVTQPLGANCQFSNCALPPGSSVTIPNDVDGPMWMFVKRADAASLS